jgi:hypothetical protein
MTNIVQPVALTGSDQAVNAGPCFYAGFTIRETAGATAVVDIYDNASAASGTKLETISLAANESARELPSRSVRASNGVYVKIVSGSVTGSIRIG